MVDQLRDSGDGQRPSVDTENPDLPLVVYLDRGRALLYRSLSECARFCHGPQIRAASFYLQLGGLLST